MNTNETNLNADVAEVIETPVAVVTPVAEVTTPVVVAKRAGYEPKAPTPVFAKDAVIKGTVTGMAEFGFHISVTEVDGAPFSGKVRALLVNNQVSGKTDDDRNARIKGLKMGDTIEGLCTRAEVVDAKNPGLKGKKIVQYAISERALIAKRGRENREAREAKENAILGLPIGSEIVGVVTENRPGLGAFVEVSEGVAAGRRALIHVSQVSDDRNKEDRDAALAEIEVGTTVTAKVSKVERNAKGFLDIGLSLREATRAQRAERQQEEVAEDEQALRDRFPEGCETTGKNARSTEDGIVVDVADGVEALLVNVDGGLSDSILRCKSTRVRFTNEVRDGRLVVEKA